MMSWWVPQVVGTLVSTQKAQMQKVEKVRYGKKLGQQHRQEQKGMGELVRLATDKQLGQSLRACPSQWATTRHRWHGCTRPRRGG